MNIIRIDVDLDARVAFTYVIVRVYFFGILVKTKEENIRNRKWKVYLKI